MEKPFKDRSWKKLVEKARRECPDCKGTGKLTDDQGAEHRCPYCYSNKLDYADECPVK